MSDQDSASEERTDSNASDSENEDTNSTQSDSDDENKSGDDSNDEQEDEKGEEKGDEKQLSFLKEIEIENTLQKFQVNVTLKNGKIKTSSVQIKETKNMLIIKNKAATKIQRAYRRYLIRQIRKLREFQRIHRIIKDKRPKKTFESRETQTSPITSPTIAPNIPNFDTLEFPNIDFYKSRPSKKAEMIEKAIRELLSEDNQPTKESTMYDYQYKI